jgi:hypothetical protein
LSLCGSVIHRLGRPSPIEADINKARAYPPSKRDVMLKKMYTVFDKVLNIDPSVDIKRVLKSILSGTILKAISSIFESICPSLMIIIL